MARGSEDAVARTASWAVLAAVAAGGALGTPARYGLARLLPRGVGGFPWATLVTNVSGAFALGFVLFLLVERFPPSRYLRPFFATGFLGAYTTFSTFAVETELLIGEDLAGLAGVYVAASLVTGFAAVWAGMASAHLVPVARRRPQ